MSDEEKNDAKRDHEPPAGAETTATWTGGAAPIDYTASAKWLVLRKKEKPAAEIFSVSYVAEGGDEDRPVTFVFNGGPGGQTNTEHQQATEVAERPAVAGDASHVLRFRDLRQKRRNQVLAAAEHVGRENHQRHRQPHISWTDERQQCSADNTADGGERKKTFL